MEGMFSDPIYGGNRNKAGWRLIGFPGAIATTSDVRQLFRFRAPIPIGLLPACCPASRKNNGTGPFACTNGLTKQATFMA
jgi:hypothetical protein